MGERERKGTIEKRWGKQGVRLLGIDEVGRGCLAGPVYAACVAINYDQLFRLKAPTLKLIRDSKTLSSSQRQKIIPVIQQVAIEWALGYASVREIEMLGIVPATFLAMRRSFERMTQSYDRILIDGNQSNPSLHLPQETVVKGDSLCYAIAAASIIAKEARDQVMSDADREFPGYGFAEHVGYGTKGHLLALEDLGITVLHRRNFAPIRDRVKGTDYELAARAGS